MAQGSHAWHNFSQASKSPRTKALAPVVRDRIGLYERRIMAAGFSAGFDCQVAEPKSSSPEMQPASCRDGVLLQNFEMLPGDSKEVYNRHAASTLDTIDTINEGDETASIASSDVSWYTDSFCAMSSAEDVTVELFAMSEDCGSFVGPALHNNFIDLTPYSFSTRSQVTLASVDLTSYRERPDISKLSCHAKGCILETGCTSSFIAMTEDGNSFIAMTGDGKSFGTKWRAVRVTIAVGKFLSLSLKVSSFCANIFHQLHAQQASGEPSDEELQLLDYQFY
jgi:hypothetical protein